MDGLTVGLRIKISNMLIVLFADKKKSPAKKTGDFL
jgi:hypothetical protein